MKRVRLGQRKDSTRVVLDLQESVYRKVFYLPEPFRLVIDVSTQPPRAPEVEPGGPRTVRRVVLDPGHGGHDPGNTEGPCNEKMMNLTVAQELANIIFEYETHPSPTFARLTRDTDVFIERMDRVDIEPGFVGADEVSVAANRKARRVALPDLFRSIHPYPLFCLAGRPEKCRWV